MKIPTTPSSVKSGTQIIPSEEISPTKTLETPTEELTRGTTFANRYEIIEELGRSGMGNLRFAVSENIDNKKLRIAKLAGNRIIVKMNAVSLPKEALKYLIVHEVAHLVTKKHNEKFWKVVESIYPDYASGKNLFESHEEHLKESGLEI